MKVKVIKAFKDKETGSILKPNLIIDISEKRVEELISSTLGPFVEVVNESDINVEETIERGNERIETTRKEKKTRDKETAPKK